jgi:hypothetical protein
MVKVETIVLLTPVFTLSVPDETIVTAPFITFISGAVAAGNAIPRRLMMYGFSSASFVTIDKIEVKVPTAVGLNVTVKLDVPPAAIVNEVIEVVKVAEPVTEAELITRADVPVFVMLSVVTSEELTVVEPTFKSPEEIMLTAPFSTFISEPVAIPVRLMMYGLSSASFVTIVKMLVRVPTVVGLNETVNVPVLPAPIVREVSDVV